MSDTPPTPAREHPTCTVSVYPCGGDTVTVYTRDFPTADEATRSLSAALDAGAAFVIGEYQPDHPDSVASLVLRPANIAAVRVLASTDTSTGQYL